MRSAMRNLEIHPIAIQSFEDGMKSTLNKSDIRILEEAGCSCIVNGGIELKGPFNLYCCSVQHGTKGAAVPAVAAALR